MYEVKLNPRTHLSDPRCLCFCLRCAFQFDITYLRLGAKSTHSSHSLQKTRCGSTSPVRGSFWRNSMRSASVFRARVPDFDDSPYTDWSSATLSGDCGRLQYQFS